MTPLRTLALAVAVFVVALPVTALVQKGPSAWLPTSTEREEGEEQEQKDDPVVDILCLKGMQELGNGNFSKAIASFTKAINRDPSYSYAYLGRGDAYLASGDLDRAARDYDQAIRLDPSNDAARERADAVRKAQQ